MGNIKELGRNFVNFAKTETTGVSYALSRGHPREAIERIVIGIPSDFKSLINETFHAAAAVHQYMLIPLIDGKGRRDVRLRGYGSLREGGINFYLYNRRMQNREGMEAARFQHFREKAFVNLLFSLGEGETLFAFLPHGMEVEDGVAMARFTKKDGKFNVQSQLLPKLSEDEAGCLLEGLEVFGGERAFMSEDENSPLWVGIKTRGEIFDFVKRQEEFKGWTAGLLGHGFWQRQVPTCQDGKGRGQEGFGGSTEASVGSCVSCLPLGSFSYHDGGPGVEISPLVPHTTRDSFSASINPHDKLKGFPKTGDKTSKVQRSVVDRGEQLIFHNEGEDISSTKDLTEQLPASEQLPVNDFLTLNTKHKPFSRRLRQEEIRVWVSKDNPEFRLKRQKKVREAVVSKRLFASLPKHGIIFEQVPKIPQEPLGFKFKVPITEIVVAQNIAEAVYLGRGLGVDITSRLLVLTMGKGKQKHLYESDSSPAVLRVPLAEQTFLVEKREVAQVIRRKSKGSKNFPAGDNVVLMLDESFLGIHEIIKKTREGIVVARPDITILSKTPIIKTLYSPLVMEQGSIDFSFGHSGFVPEKLELAFEPVLRTSRFGGGLGRYTPISIKLQYAVLWQKIFALFILSQKPKVSTVVFDRKVLAYDGVVRTISPAWNFNGGNLGSLNLQLEDYFYGIIRPHSGGFVYATLS